VFLQQRASLSHDRNRPIAIFLRKLEYFAGVLFLTTNQVNDFDIAILNRVHLKLKYHDLDRDARKTVWTQVLEGERTDQGPPIISDKELDRLVGIKLNGRDVRMSRSDVA